MEVDSIITQSHYQSFISKKTHLPLYVKYTLVKGGGDCERTTFHFKNDTKSKWIASQKQYAKTGYDEGHMANAEDFAYDCKLDEQTFRFYNCLPQTPNLNRGIWKVYEDSTRQKSQTDSLFIVCGGYWDASKPIIVNDMVVPNGCFKVVYSLKTHSFIYVLQFTNDKKAKVKVLSSPTELDVLCPKEVRDLKMYPKKEEK